MVGRSSNWGRFAEFRPEKEGHSKMTNEEILIITVFNSWKLVTSRFDKKLGSFTDEQPQQQVAPGKNPIFYLLGHLTATHDRMFPLPGLGGRLCPELDDAYITNPDRVLGPLSATELRRAGAEVNTKLTAAFSEFTPARLDGKACGSFRRGFCQRSFAQPACRRDEPHHRGPGARMALVELNARELMECIGRNVQSDEDDTI
jgi:hypothetical protein